MIDGEKLTRWYDFQAPFYSWWRDRPDSAILDHLHQALEAEPSSLRLLDAGCGSGWCALGLAGRRPDRAVVGIDASGGMLDVAGARAKRQGLEHVQLRHGDVHRVEDPDDCYDAITAAGLFANLNETAPALLEFRRLLRPGGRLFVVEFDRRQLTGIRRLVFRCMILGYRVVSTLLPRFRFSDQWNIERSTVDLDAFRDTARQLGWRQQSLTYLESHWILALSPGDP